MPASTSSTATKRVLDFTNVKESSGVNPKHLDPGDYRMKIAKVEENNSKAGNPQWVFLFVPTHMQSASYPYYCQLDEKTLWKIRNLLIAAGLQVPKKKINVDPNKLVGREIGVTLDDDEYEGKMKSVVTAVFPASDLDDEDAPDSDDEDDVEDDDVEEEPEPVKPAAKKKAKAKPAPEPEEDEDEVTEDDMEEIDIEDL